MTPSPEYLAARYAQMSETELMELARSYDALLEVAQSALRSEFARRGLEPPLVEEPQEWQLRRLVTIQRYRDLAEAYAGRSLLESAGISTWIADENLVRMDWFYSNLVGGMRLQVEESDETAAREILEQAIPTTIPYDQRKSTCSLPAQSVDRLTSPSAPGQSAGVRLWLFMFSRFQSRHESPPGIAKHAAQSGQMMVGRLGRQHKFAIEFQSPLLTAIPQTNPALPLAHHLPR